MAPQRFSRRFQGDNQVDDPGYPQSWEDKIETSDPPSRKSSPNTSLVARGATTFSHFSNGNGSGNRKWLQLKLALPASGLIPVLLTLVLVHGNTTLLI